MAAAARLSTPQQSYKLSSLVVGQPAAIADHLPRARRLLCVPFSRITPDAMKGLSRWRVI
jgi:hypothetical protein